MGSKEKHSAKYIIEAKFVVEGVVEKHDVIVLVEDGKAAGEIVSYAQGRMDGAAVQDLQRFILATTGAKLPVVKESTGIPALVVGGGMGGREC